MKHVVSVSVAIAFRTCICVCNCGVSAPQSRMLAVCRDYACSARNLPESHVRTHIFSLSSRQMWSAGKVSTTRTPSTAIILARTKVSRFQGQWPRLSFSFVVFLPSSWFFSSRKIIFRATREKLWTFPSFAKYMHNCHKSSFYSHDENAKDCK